MFWSNLFFLSFFGCWFKMIFMPWNTSCMIWELLFEIFQANIGTCFKKSQYCLLMGNREGGVILWKKYFIGSFHVSEHIDRFKAIINIKRKTRKLIKQTKNIFWFFIEGFPNLVDMRKGGPPLKSLNGNSLPPPPKIRFEIA